MPRRRLAHRARTLSKDFFSTEATSGVVLLAATVTALVWANVSTSYAEFWHTNVTMGPFENDFRHWVNDGLMTIFFFVVGLEIKREIATGDLRDRRVAALPIIAAAGGMLVPAGLYAVLNAGTAGSPGWGIPMATDIAFVLGLLALLGTRAPKGLRLFLLTLAIIDDVGAILIIAVFYSESIGFGWLAGAGGAVMLTVVLRRARVAQTLAYVLPAVALWVSLFESGIHPTIAGVALGLLTPAGTFSGGNPLRALEDWFHPVSSYIVVPVFVLANAGVVLSADAFDAALSSRIFLGVLAGLVVGKVVGISGASWVARRFGFGRLPEGLSARQLVGGSALAGVGFTVSLFITGLAFDDDRIVDQAKLGVLCASLLAAIIGAALLSVERRRS